MKKLLIMMGSYYPKPYANGICVHQIALALKKQGYEIHIVCFNKQGDKKEDLFEGIFIHRVKMRLFFRLCFYAENNIYTRKSKLVYKLAMILNKIKKIMYLPLYPMVSPVFIYRYYVRAKALHKEYNFDMVLSVYNPLEALVAGTMVKKKYPNIKFGLYVLDSLTNNTEKKYFSKSWIESKGWKWEKWSYTYADIVLNLKCHEKHHQKERYHIYRSKMKIIDIPLINKIKFDKNISLFDINYTHFVYTGALNFQNRNPQYLCELFLSLGGASEYKLHFYSRGDCEELIDQYVEKTCGNIKRYGYVNQKEALLAIYEANFLISIGNRNTDMIPSKIFEYMSTGKPIIHFYKSENDSCLTYLQKYPLTLLINENEGLEDNINKVKDFIDSPKEPLEFSKIMEMFKQNTPQYTVDIISKN